MTRAGATKKEINLTAPPPSRHWPANKINAWQVHHMKAELIIKMYSHDLPRKIQIIVIIRKVSNFQLMLQKEQKWAETPPSRHWSANKINAWHLHLMKAELIITSDESSIIKMYSHDLPNKIQIIIVNFQSFWVSQEILAQPLSKSKTSTNNFHLLWSTK